MTKLLLFVPVDPALLAPGPWGGIPPRAWYGRETVASKPCPVCGAKVRWSPAPTEQTDSCYVCSADCRHAFPQEAVYERRWSTNPWSRLRDSDEYALVLDEADSLGVTRLHDHIYRTNRQVGANLCLCRSDVLPQKVAEAAAALGLGKVVEADVVKT